MRLDLRLVVAWPKLAWVARFAEGADTITVFHGPMVEVRDDWIVEAVWAGDFAAGEFDRTDLVFGSGIRIRDNRAVFVSSGNVVDRLWYCRQGSLWHVANSLPALLACADVRLRDDYAHYTRDIETIEGLGLDRYVRSLPTSAADVHVRYFTNLSYDGGELQDVEKPDTTPSIKTFSSYRAFLFETAEQIGANLRDSGRRHAIVPLVGISSGYDSPAAAVVAKHASCTQAVTITNATSIWRGSDSGAEIAKRLRMSCRSYRQDPSAYRNEETIWAAAGRSGGRNLTLFDYPEPLCLFFNGSYGDKVWDRSHHDLSEPVGDTDSLLGEFRLIQGVFQTVVPWWGIRHAQEIHAIGSTEEMATWTLHNNYDRPIARRLVEEAGIPRGMLGIRKKNTSSNTDFYWPASAPSRESFARYLEARGLAVHSTWKVHLLHRVAHLDGLLALNVTKRFGVDFRIRERLRSGSLLFHWANEELQHRYLERLRDVPTESPSPNGVLRG